MPFIYGLFDPRTDELGYIGKTEMSLKIRLRRHLQASRLKFYTHKNEWIKSLKSQGISPEIEALEELPVDDLNEAEMFWIQYYRSIGCKLRNGTDGGDGGTMPPEALKKIALGNLGKKQSEETRRKRSEALAQPVIDDLGQVFLSVKAAAEANGVVSQSISRILRGGRASLKSGRSFRFLDTFKCLPSRINEGHRKPIIDGAGRHFESISQAARELGLREQDIIGVLKGRRNHTAGMTFFYVSAANLPVQEQG